jgi:hypothetical protein
MLKVRLAVTFLGLAMITSAVLHAQTEVVPAAPIPSQILTAKKVFISNAGGDFDSNLWSGTPDRAYNEFYAAVKSWGRFDLVGVPGDADMILEIRLVGTPLPSALFRIVLLDPKTHVVLWTEIEGIPVGLKKTRDKNFSEAINSLVADLKALTAEPAAASNPK